MTIRTCGACGTIVPEAVVTVVESMSLEGNRIWSDLCPTCAISVKEGKHPRASMSADGKLEAIPSVPAANTCLPEPLFVVGRSHQDKPIDNPDPFPIQAPLAQKVYDFFQAGGSRVHVEGPGVGHTPVDRRERILCAAVHFDDGKVRVHQPKNIATGIVICGLRHHNCFAVAGVQGWCDPTQYWRNSGGARPKSVQGFLTSADRFVDRSEAAQIARAAGQVDRARVAEDDDLISEDLY